MRASAHGRAGVAAAVFVASLMILGGGALAVASPGADLVKAHGKAQGTSNDVHVNALVTPSGQVQGILRDFSGVNDVYCVDFNVAEGIFFVPDGSRMARVGATVRTPVGFSPQEAYIFIRTPDGTNLMWGPYGLGSSGNACEMAGWSDSVPPTLWDGTLRMRD